MTRSLGLGCQGESSDGVMVGEQRELRLRPIQMQPFMSVANVTPDGPPTVDVCIGSDGLEYTVTTITGSGPFESRVLGDGTFFVHARLMHGPDGTDGGCAWFMLQWRSPWELTHGE